jgi:hypothetical protein
MRFCATLAWTTAGERAVNDMVGWTNRETRLGTSHVVCEELVNAEQANAQLP